MKAVVVDPLQGLKVEPRPQHEVDPEKVQIEVAYGGICGSDLHYAYQRSNGNYKLTEPLVLGHEIVGTVHAVGSEAHITHGIGDRVAIHPATPTPPPGGVAGRGFHLLPGSYLGSASTTPHSQGGFVQFLDVLPDQLRLLPDSLPMRRAVLAEPLAVVLHGLSRLNGQVKGARVLVSGAGPIGALAIFALHHAGVGSVVAADLQQHALDVASQVGAEETVLVAGRDSVDTNAFDIAIEASGVTKSLDTAVRATKAGGTVLQLGILPGGPLQVELGGLVSKELSLLGSQRFDVELDAAIALLDADSSVDSVITHEYSIDDAISAFECAADSSRSSKVVLKIA